MLYGGTPNDGLTFTSPGDWVRNSMSRMEPLQPGSVDLVPTVRMEQRNRPRADSSNKRCHVKPLCQNSIWGLPRPRSTGSDCGHQNSTVVKALKAKNFVSSVTVRLYLRE
jgi:hypothetical protein